MERVVLVTGSSSGIGREISRKLASDYEVIIHYNNSSEDAFNFATQLESLTEKSATFKDIKTQAEFYRDYVISAMEKLREAVDSMEVITDATYWPYKSYMDIMYSVD